MASIPPWPQEFLSRVVSDTRNALRYDDAPIREHVAAAVTSETGIIEAEELALTLLTRRWDRLGAPLASALAEVEREYSGHPARIARLRGELRRAGPDAWVARAVRAQLAFDLGFDAVAEGGGCLDL
jgi:hypothetical protein